MQSPYPLSYKTNTYSVQQVWQIQKVGEKKLKSPVILPLWPIGLSFLYFLNALQLLNIVLCLDFDLHMVGWTYLLTSAFSQNSTDK